MLSGNTMPIRPPGFNIWRHRSRKRICGERLSSNCVVRAGCFVALSRAHLYPRSYCERTAAPLIGIFAPKGGLVSSTSNFPSCTLDCVIGCHSEDGSREFSQNIPPRPSPMSAIYALQTLARNASLSMPRKQSVATSISRLTCCPTDQFLLFPSSRKYPQTWASAVMRNPPDPHAGSIICSPGLGSEFRPSFSQRCAA